MSRSTATSCAGRSCEIAAVASGLLVGQIRRLDDMAPAPAKNRTPHGISLGRPSAHDGQPSPARHA
jgi:hypothetical protein